VFAGWSGTFPTLDLYAVDLQAGLAVAEAAMTNYEAAVVSAAALVRRPLALCGWSMGGLAAMTAARRIEPDLLVLLEPSPPAEVQGVTPAVAVDPGTFDPEGVYGAFPPGVPSRVESALARAERKQGVSVPSLPGPTLVVSGRDFPEERGSAIARYYGAEHLALPEASHWDLVLDAAVRERLAELIAGRSR
jgi:pimeloyl-ACP methyl ester carboxylesterase